MQLERPRYDEQRDARHANGIGYDLGPVPLPPDFSAVLEHHAASSQTREQGQGQQVEQAARTANGTHSGPQQTLWTAAVTVDSSQDAASKELVTSLSATEHSFIDTLHSLVCRNFASALRSSSSGENGNTVNADSSSILHASTSTAGKSDDRVIAEEDVALQPLLGDLRKACNTLEDPFAGAEMRQLIATSKEGAGAIQEIRTRLDYLAPYFSFATSTEQANSDAQAAKNLVSMLGIIRRLQTLYKASPFLASSHPFATPLPTPGQEGRFSFEVQEGDKPVSEGSKEIYSALQKQAKALQSASLSRQESYDSANIVRAVEEAEVELLWGRLGDLLGNTMQAFKLTSPNRTPSTTRRANHEYLFGATPAMSNDVAAFDNQNALPEYSSLEPPSYDRGDFDDEKDSLDSVKDSSEREVNGQTGGRTLPRTPLISSSDEKMQMDLDRMASAIERLYVSAPQLANQRVDAVNFNNIEARQQMRERQLAKLGSAIERLCKGRLEDQRASLLHHNQNENVNNPFASSRSRSKSRERDLQKESLDRLLDEIDRAAARTLDGQRASMNSRQQNALIGARKTARLATADLHFDNDEIAFRDYLMESVGKGRFTGQDASFTLNQPPYSATQSTSASKLAMKRRSFAHVFDDDPSASGDHEKRNRLRSNSVGATPTPPLPAIPASYANENGARPAIKKRFSVSRLLAGKDASTLLGAPMTRRSSKSTPNNSRPTSTCGPKLGQLTYTVEEMTNLGSMVLQLWENVSQADLQINPDPLSISLLDSMTVQVNQPEVQFAIEDNTKLQLTSEAQASLVGSSKPLDLLYKADHYEIELPTAVSTQFTRSRDDLDIASPYSAQDFRKHQPDSLTCTSCGAELADLAQVTRYNDLPSEHWAELLDAWMCHPDQTLSKDIIDKGNNIWPQANQALISTTGIVLATSNSKGWVVAEELEPVHHSDGKWLVAKCKSCRALVGRSSPGPTRDISEKSAYVRFSKFAIQPASTSFMPICPLSLHLTATLLETSLARAIHRFVIEDEEEGTNQLILWVFNPYVRLFSNHPVFESSAPVNAAKILYKAGKIDDSDIVRLIGNAEHETLTYPRGICLQLAEILQASTTIYPKSHQKLGEWDVGWLERDVGRQT